MACEDGSWFELARKKSYWHMLGAEKYRVPIRTSFKRDIMDGRSCCIILYHVAKNYMPTLGIMYN
jgi:hypothetical protein